MANVFLQLGTVGRRRVTPWLIQICVLIMKLCYISGQVSDQVEITPCRSRIEVNEPAAGQNFTLLFRNAVEGSPVDVRCSMSRLGNNSRIQVVLNETVLRADIGELSVQFSYDVLEVGGETNVTCHATSQFPSTQYIGVDPSLEILPPSLTLRQPGSSILTTVLLSYVPVQETNLSVACGIFSNATATSDTELHGQLCNALTGDIDPMSIVPTPVTFTDDSFSLTSDIELVNSSSPLTMALPAGSRAVSFLVSSPDTEAVDSVFSRQRLFCCLPQCSGNCSVKRFAGVFTSTEIVINISESINGTSFSELVSSRAASSLSVNLCVCDLQVLTCDYSCCCDPDCTSDDRLLMSICDTPSAAPLLSESCAAEGNSEWADWKSVLCVHNDNNPDLGLTFINSSSATSGGQFETFLRLAAANRTTYTTNQASTPPVSATGYRQNDPVLTAPSGPSSPAGLLTLPASSAVGCVDESPVQYLVNRRSTCSRRVTVHECSPFSSLDLLRYLTIDLEPNLGTAPMSGQCWKGSGVMQSPPASSSAVAAGCSVSLTCQTTAQATHSQSLGGTTSALLADLGQPPELQTDNSTVPCNLLAPSLPPQPTLNLPAGMCDNTLLSLAYDFQWSGGELLSVAVSAVLGQATINTSVVQTFSVSYRSLHTGTTEPCSQSQSVVSVSGNPGYVAGRSLRVGSSSSPAGRVDGNSSRLSVWNPSHTSRSLCSESDQLDLLFGRDRSSGCLLQLTLDDISVRCAFIRQQVLDLQEELVSATHVSTTGNASFTSSADWIEILRSTVDLNDTNATVTAMPPTVFQLNQTNATNSTNATARAQPFPLAGLCAAVPSHLDITVLFTSVGRDTNDQPRYQVVGAHTNITASDWLFPCPSGADCGNGNSTQMFELHSRVQFVEVPSKVNDLRLSDIEAQQNNPCRYDLCADEFFYPASHYFWSMLDQRDQLFTLATTTLLAIAIGLTALLLNHTWHPPDIS